MNQKKINEVYPAWLTAGVFESLEQLDVPWAESVSAGSLDLAYHGGHSGQKFISPLVKSLMSGDSLTAAEQEIIAVTIFSLYGRTWSKEWDTLSLQYNPIENYRMEEVMENDDTTFTYGKRNTRTNNLSHTKTGTETETKNLADSRTEDKTGTETETRNLRDIKTEEKTGTDTQTKNLTDTRTPNIETETVRKINGFNSAATGVPSGTDTTTETGVETNRQTGTDSIQYNNMLETDETHTGTDTMTYNTEVQTDETHTGTDTIQHNTTEADTGTQSDVESGEDSKTHGYELTRSGNIGVTTSQQMIESERALWMWNFFYDVVFPDVDKVLTLSVY